MGRIVGGIFVLMLILTAMDCYSQEILRTDTTGKILDGDRSDWSFDKENYEMNILTKAVFYPVSYIYLPSVPVLNFEFKIQGLLVKWSVERESNCDGYYIERAGYNYKYDVNSFEKIGFVKAMNDQYEVNYEFLDREAEQYTSYAYRLKRVLENGDNEYYDGGVYFFPLISSELYPVYPNPVSGKFNLRFYLSDKDKVRIFFQKNDQVKYILNDTDLDQGFYLLELDKSKFPYTNETVRLYMECETCSNGGYFGDVEFK